MPSRLSILGVGFGALLCAWCATGCRSDAYYQNRAAERARSYLLDNAKELSAEEKYFVTFNDPVFLTAPIIGDFNFVKEQSQNAPVLNDQLMQICIAWKMPQREEWYLVYGASNGRMDFWYPDRLIRKKFHASKISGLERAVAQSRTYARNNLFDLMSAREQNFIRFNFPAVYETNFELNFNPTGQASPEDVEKARALAERSIQYSLVWAEPGDPDIAVFCGTGAAEMQGWQINFAGKTSKDELRRHTVKIIKTPEQFYRDFPLEYRKQDVRQVKSNPVVKER